MTDHDHSLEVYLCWFYRRELPGLATAVPR